MRPTKPVMVAPYELYVQIVRTMEDYPANEVGSVLLGYELEVLLPKGSLIAYLPVDFVANSGTETQIDSNLYELAINALNRKPEIEREVVGALNLKGMKKLVGGMHSHPEWYGLVLTDLDFRGIKNILTHPTTAKIASNPWIETIVHPLEKDENGLVKDSTYWISQNEFGPTELYLCQLESLIKGYEEVFEKVWEDFRTKFNPRTPIRF